jgi:hypothetical protein
MAYLINNYDGSPLVNVQDRTLNISTTSLKLPGRDYRPYGETMVENLIHMLQHFAQGVPPQNPINGQIWYDTSFKQLKVYDVTTLGWIPVGSPQSGATLPGSGSVGQVFYNTVKRQLFVWDANATPPAWRLVGPMGAFDNSETPTAIPTHSAWEVVQIAEPVTSNLFTVWRLTIAGVLVAIVASNTFNAGIPGFADPILPGINLRTNFNLMGTASRALVSDNTNALNGLPATRFMRTDVNNEPDQAGVRSLGSASKPYASVHATSFVGNATSATLTTTATTALTATTATNAQNLNGEPAAFYQNASNLITGTVAEAQLPNSVMLKSGSTMTGDLILNGAPTNNLQAATKQYVDASAISVFETSPFAIANTGVYSFTHGLGGMPRFVTVDLVNKVANGGYNPGDVIQVSAGADPVGSTEGVAVKKTATTITIYVAQNGPSEYVRGDGTGAGVVLVSDRWDMVVRAYR